MTMNSDQALQQIQKIFKKYKSLAQKDMDHLTRLGDGKLYELYVLSEVVTNLASRGFNLRLTGTTLKFKGGPGMIKLRDPHFVVTKPNHTELRLFVNIEFKTFGYFWQGQFL